MLPINQSAQSWLTIHTNMEPVLLHGCTNTNMCWKTVTRKVNPNQGLLEISWYDSHGSLELPVKSRHPRQFSVVSSLDEIPIAIEILINLCFRFCWARPTSQSCFIISTRNWFMCLAETRSKDTSQKLYTQHGSLAGNLISCKHNFVVLLFVLYEIGHKLEIV